MTLSGLTYLNVNTLNRRETLLHQLRHFVLWLIKNLTAFIRKKNTHNTLNLESGRDYWYIKKKHTLLWFSSLSIVWQCFMSVQVFCFFNVAANLKKWNRWGRLNTFSIGRNVTFYAHVFGTTLTVVNSVFFPRLRTAKESSRYSKGILANFGSNFPYF